MLKNWKNADKSFRQLSFPRRNILLETKTDPYDIRICNILTSNYLRAFFLLTLDGFLSDGKPVFVRTLSILPQKAMGCRREVNAFIGGTLCLVDMKAMLSQSQAGFSSSSSVCFLRENACFVTRKVFFLLSSNVKIRQKNVHLSSAGFDVL